MQHLRFVPTLTHGLVDNLLGILMAISPWIFDFHAVRGEAVLAPILFGGLLIASGLLTRHEMGLANLLGMRAHLVIDVVLGLLLALSPFVLGFSDRVFLPHVLAGSFLTLLPLFSVREPFDENKYTEVVIRNGRAEVVRYARSSDSSTSMGRRNS
jgi:hypothetical protein